MYTSVRGRRMFAGQAKALWSAATSRAFTLADLSASKGGFSAQALTKWGRLDEFDGGKSLEKAVTSHRAPNSLAPNSGDGVLGIGLEIFAVRVVVFAKLVSERAHADVEHAGGVGAVALARSNRGEDLAFLDFRKRGQLAVDGQRPGARDGWLQGQL